MAIVRGLLAAAPNVASALVCIALAIAPEAFPERAGIWALSMHFAQPLLALTTLVYGETLNIGLSTSKRMLLFFGSQIVLGLLGLLFARDLMLDPIIASALAWSVVGHAVCLFLPSKEVSVEAARVLALAKDGWELWALVSGAGVVIAFAVAFAVSSAQAAWAALIPAAYFLLMSAAAFHVQSRAFALRPLGLSDSRIVRTLWSWLPSSRSEAE